MAISLIWPNGRHWRDTDESPHQAAIATQAPVHKPEEDEPEQEEEDPAEGGDALLAPGSSRGRRPLIAA